VSTNSNLFRLVMTGVMPVRTKESIGGSTTVPTKTYMGLCRMGSIADIGAPLMVIKNIDENISDNTYSTFFPFEVRVVGVDDVGIKIILIPYEQSNSLQIAKITGNLIAPRLILSNDETPQTYEFKDPAVCENYLSIIAKFLSGSEYDVEILTAEQVKTIVDEINSREDRNDYEAELITDDGTPMAVGHI